MLALEWTKGFSVGAFAEDRKTFYAVTRCLEVISEASRRLSDEVLTRGSTIPWREIRAAGNVYRHQYDSVLETNVFGTVRDDLPVLARFVEQELER